MAFNYSPKVVTNGLVLYLDAANTRSYPGSGTTWTDLSRSGVNGTLTNGPTFSSGSGGSILFDGVNDYVDVGSSLILTNNFTVSAWCRITNSTGTVMFGFYNTSSPFNGWGVGNSSNVASTGKLTFWDSSGWKNSTITISDGVWKQVTVAVSSTYLLSFYANGAFVTSIAGGTISSFAGTKTIGGLTVGFGVSGNIANAQLYNRALSAQEILQNYNATKSRFGL
jgi:hypothetical protein